MRETSLLSRFLFSFIAFNILVNVGVVLTYPILISIGTVLSVPGNAGTNDRLQWFFLKKCILINSFISVFYIAGIDLQHFFRGNIRFFIKKFPRNNTDGHPSTKGI